MHGAARSFPIATRHQASIPSIGHFNDLVVAPVFAAPAAGVMGNFADRHGGVTVLPKPFRHAGRNRFEVVCHSFGSIKNRHIARRPVSTRQHRIA